MMNLRTLCYTIALALSLAAVSATNAQTDSDWSLMGTTQATYMAGLDNVKIGEKGDLRLTKRSIDFESGNVKLSLPLNEIAAVYTGDERAEKGGTAGQIARKLPYGAGHVAGAAMQTSVDVLTFEYHDQRGSLHGAVFILPKGEAEAIKQSIDPELVAYSQNPPEGCSTHHMQPRSILVAPIDSQDVDVPAEYRLLIYERLITDLQHKLVDYAVYRSGDPAAGPGCTALTLHFTVTEFKKGDEAERGTVGMFGLFIGTTSISYRLTLDGSHGAILLDKTLQGSRRGDHESLTLADMIATRTSKKVDKAVNDSGNGTGEED
jgi:hypothetical protein